MLRKEEEEGWPAKGSKRKERTCDGQHILEVRFHRNTHLIGSDGLGISRWGVVHVTSCDTMACTSRSSQLLLSPSSA